MIKKLFCLLFLIIILQVQAGEYQKHINNDEKVFLYLYTPTCSYCIKFDNIYEKLNKHYGNKCKFLRIDATNKEGHAIISNYKVYYVPFVLLVDRKTEKELQISPYCLINYSCVEPIVKDFVK